MTLGSLNTKCRAKSFWCLDLSAKKNRSTSAASSFAEKRTHHMSAGQRPVCRMGKQSGYRPAAAVKKWLALLPCITSVGVETDVHRSAGNGLPI